MSRIEGYRYDMPRAHAVRDWLTTYCSYDLIDLQRTMASWLHRLGRHVDIDGAERALCVSLFGLNALRQCGSVARHPLPPAACSCRHGMAWDVCPAPLSWEYRTTLWSSIVIKLSLLWRRFGCGSVCKLRETGEPCLDGKTHARVMRTYVVQHRGENAFQGTGSYVFVAADGKPQPWCGFLRPNRMLACVHLLERRSSRS
jgi:hypothetical protein